MARNRRVVSTVTLSGRDYDLFLCFPTAVARSGALLQNTPFSDEGLDDLASSWGAKFHEGQKGELRRILRAYLIKAEAEKTTPDLSRAVRHAESICSAANTLMNFLTPATQDDQQTRDAQAEALDAIEDQLMERLARVEDLEEDPLQGVDSVWYLLDHLATAAHLAKAELMSRPVSPADQRGHASRALFQALLRFGEEHGFSTTANKGVGQQKPGRAPSPFLRFLADLRQRLPTGLRFCEGASLAGIASAVHEARQSDG